MRHHSNRTCHSALDRDNTLTTMPNWNKSDDAKLLQLVRDGTIDATDRSLKAVKKIHADNWSSRPYKSFAEFIRKKLRRIENNQLRTGGRGEFLDVLCSMSCEDDDLSCLSYPFQCQ